MRQGLPKLEKTGLIIAGLILLVALVGGVSYLLWPQRTRGTVAHPQSLTSQKTEALPSEPNPQIAASLPGSRMVQPHVPLVLPTSAKPLRVPILMYHYVDAAPPPAGPYAAGLTIPTAQFRAQMNYLAAGGYHPVTLQQIYAAMAGLSSLPAKPVALTFDDGGLDDYTSAFPILQSHRFVATFFVITGFVGKPISRRLQFVDTPLPRW